MALLHSLRASGGDYLAAPTAGDERETFERDLRELERFGFAIERHPILGVSYRGPAARLCPDQIEWGLATSRIGRRVAVWNRVRSTNDIAAKAAGSTANDGLVVLAEEQTAGRGRRGRTWQAAPMSSLLMSVLIFPRAPLDHPGWLTALGAVAVAEVVEEAIGAPARIKWPNDVRIGGRKVAGILVERAQGAVVGIGLNVQTTAEEFPDDLRATATSLAAESGRKFDRSELARRLIERLDAHDRRGLRDGAEPLVETWLGRLEWRGERVVVATSSGEVRGTLVAADPRVGLRVEDDGGTAHEVANVDVVSVASGHAG